MSFLDDLKNVVGSVRAQVLNVEGTAAQVQSLQPLADRALRGDTSAEAQLHALAADPTQPPTVNAAAKLLLDYVAVRKQVGQTATAAGVGIYPGQVAPLLLVGAGLVLLLLWRRR